MPGQTTHARAHAACGADRVRGGPRAGPLPPHRGASTASMSLELDWSLVTQALADRLRDRINELLSVVELPSYMGPLHLHALEFGTEAPELQVEHIGDVWREFREATASAQRNEPYTTASPPTASVAGMQAPLGPMRMRTFRQYDSELPVSVNADEELSELDDEESMLRWSESGSEAGFTDSGTMASDMPSTTSGSGLPSLQVHVRVQWLSGSVRAGLTTTLQIHQGDTAIMSLPVSIQLTSLEVVGQAVIALDGEHRCVYVTLCEDERAREASGGRARHKAVRIVPFLGFDSRIGEPTRHVLENVGKVERFAGDLVRQLLEAELVFPNFYTLALPES